MSRPVTAISPRRQQVFEFIVRFKQEHDGNSPSIREIMTACNISSNSVAHYFVHQLVKEGRLMISRKDARMIEVVGGRWTWTGKSVKEQQAIAS